MGLVPKYATPMLTGFICAGIMVASLVAGKTRAWFQEAGEARREHRELLQLLGD